MIVNQMKNYHGEVDECAAIRSVLRFITEGRFILMPWPWYCEGPYTHLVTVPQNIESTIEFCVVLGFQL